MDSDKTVDEAALDDSSQSEAGSVEDAGETTAAGTITGPVDTKPVGADTMLKVSEGTNQKENADD